MINYKQLIVPLIIIFVILILALVKIFLDYGIILTITLWLLIFSLYFTVIWLIGAISILEAKLSILISINEIAYNTKLTQIKLNEKAGEFKKMAEKGAKLRKNLEEKAKNDI